MNRAFFAGMFVAALALSLGAPSCRSLSLCDAAGGCAQALATGGTAGDSGAPGGERNGTGQGGADPGTSHGGAAGEEAATIGVCEMPLADCDNSTLTDCETDTRWNTLHCGDCGKPCAGVCAWGDCHPGEIILDVGSVNAIVSTQTHVYAIAHDGNWEENLLSIDRRSGAAAVMAQLPSPDVALHKGADRLYVCDNWEQVVSSIAFGGTALVPEDFSADEMGTSREGVYYRLSGELWFRSNKAGEPTVLVEGLSGSPVQLLSDGNSLVVVTESEDGAEVHLMDGAHPWLLGPRPENVVALRPIDDGLVMIEPRADDPNLHELHWLAFLGPEWTYRLDGKLDTEFFGRLDDSVAVELQEGPAEFVLVIGRNGNDGVKIGLPQDSVFLHIDDTHVWYMDQGTSWDSRFMRAPYH